ncbi:phage tail tape measure protein, partial [Ideonella paludis]
MRDLKLRYVIQLLSNLETQSGKDAKAMVEAQQRVQKALSDTEGKVGRLEKVLLRVAGAGTASAERQAMVLARLAVRYDQVASAAERYAKAAAKAAPQVMAGGAAGAYAVGAMTQRPMDYSTRLAQMSNTAFAQRDVAGRIYGKQTLDAAIRAAVRVGGGSRDSAAEALDALIASGTMSPQQAITLLPRLMKGSTASGATPTELGMIGVRSAQSFRIPMEQMDQVLNEAMAAGQAGGFELRDMAKWLPQTMAAAGTAGMGGMGDFRRLLASMQAGVTTAGTKDEAGNNLVNLLAKINSRDTANDFSKQGIDLTGRLAKARGQGVNALDAFVDLVDEVASRDKAFVEAKRKLAAAGTAGEKADAANSVLQLLQGKAVGQVIQDRQALMALVAELGQRDYIKSVMQRSRADTGAINTAFGVMSQETGFAKQQAANELAFAQDTAFKAVEPVFKGIFESGSEVARMFPNLAAATVGLTGAFATAAAALGGGAVGGLLAGRGAAAAAGAAAGAGAGAAGAS